MSGDHGPFRNQVKMVTEVHGRSVGGKTNKTLAVVILKQDLTLYSVDSFTFPGILLSQFHWNITIQSDFYNNMHLFCFWEP